MLLYLFGVVCGTLIGIFAADVRLQNRKTRKTAKKIRQALLTGVLERDNAPIVVCDRRSVIVYMNPAARARYRGDLVGANVKTCHPLAAQEKIDRVLNWFSESADHNVVYTYHGDEENKDVYMVALRDTDGTLLGYYEKHEFRTPETMKRYHFESSR